jgi:predicted nucleic acid-binding protein
MSTLHQIDIVGEALAVQAATNFRHLRSLGITVRKTIDTLIATRCIENGLPLLYSDRDFDPFVEHLGLTSALTTLD